MIRAMNPDLLVKNYHYDLPEELIAQRPAEPRDHSRLLVYKRETDEVIHDTFYNLPKYLPKDSALVLNNSRVFPCRLQAQKSSGAKAEIFFLSLKEQEKGYPCLIKTSSKKNIGDRFLCEGGTFEISERGEDGTFFVRAFDCEVAHLLNERGNIPIPPYIRKGESDEQDLKDYQTTYAGGDSGSVAAPTAGLHFTPRVFSELKEKGIHPHFVTLHVGLGTFRPVKSESLSDHTMHKENFFVEKEEWQKIINAPKRIAVGTTSLRVLESLWPERDQVRGGEMYDTDIFLHPGVTVHSIDGLLTNFHLPESTLIMLVSSLIGRERTLALYETAVGHGYRFFSYGDAMLIH